MGSPQLLYEVNTRFSISELIVDYFPHESPGPGATEGSQEHPFSLGGPFGLNPDIFTNSEISHFKFKFNEVLQADRLSSKKATVKN